MISIILPVHVYDEYSKLAIESMLIQTFAEFELIIVANGDNYESIFNSIESDYSDQRIVLIKSPIGQLAFAVNFALGYAKYELIARMDADDISVPNRLELQYEYLKNENLDMVGSDLKLIDENGSDLGYRTYPKGRKINQLLPLKNCFAHNTILVKKSILLKLRGYNSGFNTEDYDLWLRMLRDGSVKWDNMDEFLVLYRIHSNSTQRHKLSYAEAAGLALRECLLSFTFKKMVAVCSNILKCLILVR